MNKWVFVLFFVCTVTTNITAAQFRQDTTSTILELNPKQVETFDINIIQSGSFDVTGTIEHANITMYIPQENIKNIDVDAESSRFIEDLFGNKLIVLEWYKPQGRIQYRVGTRVENRAKRFETSGRIGTNPAYLAENEQVVFTPELQKIAFPKKQTVEHAAELAAFVHEYVDYDLAVSGQLQPSDWVYENKRGVCVEYANLLSSLLKLSDIPTRYVVGYAYSTVQNKLVGHTWVEILREDGSWMPIDPTWLQAGYLDATHIKTTNTQNANQTIVLSYAGNGKIVWNRNNDEIQIIGYSTTNTTVLQTQDDTIAGTEYGVLPVTIHTNTCTLTTVHAASCVDERRQPVLDIKHPDQTVWVCGQKTIYYPYHTRKESHKHVAYTCPVTVYDENGASTKAVISIQGTTTPAPVAISGPNTVGINEAFFLETPKEGLLFSPTTKSTYANNQKLMFDRPGEYLFYFFTNGALAEKAVQVVEEKEFSIQVHHGTNTTQHVPIEIHVTITNEKNIATDAEITIDFDANVTKETRYIGPKGTLTIAVNKSTATQGTQHLFVSVAKDTITSYSSVILVEEQKQLRTNPLDEIISFFDRLIQYLLSFF